MTNEFRPVLQKLIFFTLAMVVLPLSSFFVCQTFVTDNAVVCGGTAAILANVVLIGYIVTAFTEESVVDEKEELKKTR